MRLPPAQGPPEPAVAEGHTSPSQHSHWAAGSQSSLTPGNCGPNERSLLAGGTPTAGPGNWPHCKIKDLGHKMPHVPLAGAAVAGRHTPRGRPRPAWPAARIAHLLACGPPGHMLQDCLQQDSGRGDCGLYQPHPQGNGRERSRVSTPGRVRGRQGRGWTPAGGGSTWDSGVGTAGRASL